jgi:excisionase family DNA binding protein
VSLHLAIPDEVIEAIAARAAEIVLERLGDVRGVPELLDPGEAAEFLRCRRQRVYELHSAGKLRGYRDGGRLLFRRVDLEVYVGLREAVPPARRRAA